MGVSVDVKNVNRMKMFTFFVSFSPPPLSYIGRHRTFLIYKSPYSPKSLSNGRLNSNLLSIFTKLQTKTLE